jgi:hypothetical protein
MQNNEANKDEHTRAFQSRYVSQRMQVDTYVWSNHSMVPNKCTNNDSQPHEDEHAK